MHTLPPKEFEIEEGDIFQEYYDLLEYNHLYNDSNINHEQIIHSIAKIEKAYGTYVNKYGDKCGKIVYSYLDHCLDCFLFLFKLNGLSDRPVFKAFLKYLNFAELTLNHIGLIKSPRFFFRNISKNFPTLWKGEFVDIVKDKDLPSIAPYHFENFIAEIEDSISSEFGTKVANRLKSATYSNGLNIYCENFEVKKTKWNISYFQFEIIDSSYEMAIYFHISNNENDAAKLFQSITLITSALSQIDGVHVEIEDLKVGSLIAKIRLYIKNLLAKEETKAVLASTKEALIKTASGGMVSHSDVKKSKAEIQKLEGESKLLEIELNSKPSEIEYQISNALMLEKQALENEKLRIEIAKDKIEIIEKLSQLATQGILQADEIKIEINDFLFLVNNSQSPRFPHVNINDIT
ncbi:MAG: hypothetical protein LBE37_13545 [Sphingobacterium sp.]|jgi:hypothetical protein|nr:hypothetical protein [Sphingobacterium sp.]